jgi:hypothetical protein
MSDSKTKNDEMDAFMVRFLDFLTDALNDPAIVAKNTPLVQTIIAGLDLVTKDPEVKAKINLKTVDMAELGRLIGKAAESAQKNARLRMTVAETQQELVAAQAEAQRASIMFNAMSDVMKNIGQTTQNAARRD